MKKKYIPLFLGFLILGMTITNNTWGQNRQTRQENQKKKSVPIESVVIDESGAPIPNALISGNEGAIETRTNNEGRFSINVSDGTFLLVEAKSYDSKVVNFLDARNKITLVKAPFLMEKSNIVNIPFGQKMKRELTGAVSVVNPGEFIKYDNSQLVYDALLARVPGIIGNTNIRGLGEAVIIVDGIPRDVTNINLSEVEQVTVLKDANAAMLYGAQAKDGVIMITTKRGQAHKRIINLSLEQGISTVTKLPMYLGSADYMNLYNEGLENDGLSKFYHDTIVSKYAGGTNPYRYPDVDYYSSDFIKNTKSFSRVLSEFSGGNENTQYYANLGLTRSGSLLTLGEGANANNNRINVRTNVNFTVNDYIKSYVDAVAIFDVAKNPVGNFWSDASTLQPYYYSPLIPVSYVTDETILKTAKRVKSDYILGGTSQYLNNVYGNMLFAGSDQTIRRTVQFNSGIDVDLGKITEGLKFKTYLSFDIFNRFNQTVTNKYAIYEPKWVTTSGADVISSIIKRGTDEVNGVQSLNTPEFIRRYGAYAMFDYNRTFNNVHSVNGTLVGYYSMFEQNGVVVDIKNAHLGMRISYDYGKKYFIDFSNVIVNSTKLIKGNRAGFSPSIGLGWVISDEDFLADKSSIDYLKLRASAAIMNTDKDITNPSGSNYLLYESTLISGSSFQWNDALRSNGSVSIARSANPGLFYEKVKDINLGLEGYFFDRSLNIDANLFHSRNSGKITRRSSVYPSYLSNYYPFENYDEDSFTGAELGIVVSKSLGKISFDIGTNFLYTTSKVVIRDELYAYDYLFRQGGPTDALFGLEALGLFQNLTEIANSPVQKFGEVVPGDIKYKDQNADGIIDQNDEVQIGNWQARFSYGLHVTMRYKNLTLFLLGNGINGAEAIKSNRYYWVDGNYKYSEVVLDRWTPETATTATYPRMTSKSNPNNFRNSTFWLYSNDYFTLNRVQLTYDIPKSLIQKFAAKDISLYLRGSNLVTISQNKDIRELNIGVEPQTRNYALGFTMMF